MQCLADRSRRPRRHHLGHVRRRRRGPDARSTSTTSSRLLRQVHRILKPSMPFVISVPHPYAERVGRRAVRRRSAHGRRVVHHARPVELPRRPSPRTRREQRSPVTHDPHPARPQGRLVEPADVRLLRTGGEGAPATSRTLGRPRPATQPGEAEQSGEGAFGFGDAGGAGATEEVALGAVAVELAQTVQLQRRLHALGDDRSTRASARGGRPPPRSTCRRPPDRGRVTNERSILIASTGNRLR